MYSKYIEKNNWKILFMNSSTSSVGVFSNIVFNVLGKGIYSKSKYGSIVLVMPEEKEIDVSINPNDIDVDTYRSQGEGDQNVNETE